MALRGITEYLSRLWKTANKAKTAYGEEKIAGQDVLSASSTELPPNQRFALIKDNDHLTMDEFIADVTHNRPLYEISVSDNQEYIFRGRERDTYFPGTEAVSGVAFEVRSDIPDGQFLPGNTVVESGYAGLENGSLTGTPYSNTKDKDGVVLRIEDSTAEARAYKSGDVASSLHHTDWDVDIFNDERYEWLPNQYTLFRWVFDLYGSGDATLFGRIRNKIGDEVDYVEICTLTVPNKALLDVYSLPPSVLFETTTTVSDNFEVSVGPVSFLNRTGGQPPTRDKSVAYRNTTVPAGFSDTQGTVIAVYRLDPSRREAVTRVSSIEAATSNDDYKLEVRKVHPDHLTWPAGFDEKADSNWESPGDQRTADTSVQEAKVSPGDVTIETHTDEDGKTKMRGMQNVYTVATAGGGSKGSASGKEAATLMSELDYLALIGRAAGDPDIEKVDWVQRW